jgi:hypothetical protein
MYIYMCKHMAAYSNYCRYSCDSQMTASTHHLGVTTRPACTCT